jgi:medium-chain acyl-[acyl-carrier-protein] hydrolase
MINARTAWLVVPKPNPDAAVRLFCFPYAGAGASTYREWANLVLPTVELMIVQYPGREERYSEPLHKHVDSLLPILSESLLGCIDKPFVFFGHSMGAGIAHRLLLAWQQRDVACAQHLIVSGARAPQLISDRPTSSELDDCQFLSLLQNRGGMPEELLQNAELMEVLMPRLRADFQLAETLPPVAHKLLNCPISAFGGHHDSEISLNDIDEWRLQTLSVFKAWGFKGDHFFIQNSRAQVISIVNHILALEINSSGFTN